MSAPRSHWQRFTTAERIWRSTVYLTVVIALVWSAHSIEINREFLADAPAQTVDLFGRMWPFDWPYYRATIHEALIESVHMATLGTMLSVALAGPLALLAARNITPFAVLNWAATGVLVATRSINVFVWALLFVAVFGPGPLAGLLAIGLHSVGFVGKLLAEALEEVPRGPIEALTATGAPATSVLAKGYWPFVLPSFWSIALLRWDINIRESAVLGLVGGGGLGMALDTSLSNLYWDQVGLILAVIFVVVILAEIATSALRSRMI